MRFKEKLLKDYEQDGYVCLHNYFSPEEVARIKAQLPDVFAEDSPRRVLEKSNGIVRSVYGSHTTNQLLSRLVRHPRLVEPARQLLDSDVYVHQFKINAKAAFGGDLWQWHQDYIFWRNEDGMGAPRVVNVAIFLDEVTEFNGPLFLVPGSHREGVIEVPPSERRLAESDGAQAYRHSPSWINNLTADLKYSIDLNKMAGLIDSHGIAAPKGDAGMTLFFHGNIVHGSANNISPYSRVVALITYNSVNNVPVPPANKVRPDFLAATDTAALVPLSDRTLFE
jgi:ectoine hydroxylase